MVRQVGGTAKTTDRIADTLQEMYSNRNAKLSFIFVLSCDCLEVFKVCKR